MNVDALRVLDQLPLKRLGVVDIDDAGGKGKQLGKLRGAEASRSCDDLEAVSLGRTVMGWMRPLVRMLSASSPSLHSSKVRRGLVADSWMVSMAMYWNSLLFCMVLLLWLRCVRRGAALLSPLRGRETG